MPDRTRVIADLRHGGHALADALYGADPANEQIAGVSRLCDVVGDDAVTRATDDGSTPFGYLFPDLQDAYPAAHLPIDEPNVVVGALKALGSAMVDLEAEPPDATEDLSNSTIPPIYTYWGQFIDHDLTANTDRDVDLSIVDKPLTPLAPDAVLATLRNLREPALNLDPLYGDGPFSTGGRNPVPYVGIEFELGTNEDSPGADVPPFGDVRRDLPRDPVTKKALIGDGRNDENLIVAQLHVAFLRFHNAVVRWVRDNEPDVQGDEAVFGRARDLVRWHYQWLVVHDFLETVAAPGVAREVLARNADLLQPVGGATYMPLEFSVAAFRFGHSMVRAEYDFNRNFGRSQDGSVPLIPDRAPFDLLFLFTGNGEPPLSGFGSLPTNWRIEWDRFIHRKPEHADRLARRIDTQVAFPLTELLNEGRGHLARRVKDILRRLAVRNLLRGYKLGIPTGQAVARALGVVPLTHAELEAGTPIVNNALRDGDFLDATPLWFYILKEAEVRHGGNCLGEVGSHIICQTIIGQIVQDPTSYLRQSPEWSPRDAPLIGGAGIESIADVLRFAGVL